MANEQERDCVGVIEALLKRYGVRISDYGLCQCRSQVNPNDTFLAYVTGFWRADGTRLGESEVDAKLVRQAPSGSRFRIEQDTVRLRALIEHAGLQPVEPGV